MLDFTKLYKNRNNDIENIEIPQRRPTIEMSENNNVINKNEGIEKFLMRIAIIISLDLTILCFTLSYKLLTT
jgi:hypothetical protein